MTTLPTFPTVLASPLFLPIVCVSASKQIETGTERRASGFIYVQGSGDDHELWGMVG
jgi:tRNA A64-2'-O-ribosylphosphate transferase